MKQSRKFFYEVFVYWPEPQGTFVVSCDNDAKRIEFFTKEDKMHAVAIFDLFLFNMRVPTVGHFSDKIIFMVIALLRRCFEQQEHPEVISHTNCAMNVLMRQIN